MKSTAQGIPYVEGIDPVAWATSMKAMAEAIDAILAANGTKMASAYTSYAANTDAKYAALVAQSNATIDAAKAAFTDYAAQVAGSDAGRLLTTAQAAQASAAQAQSSADKAASDAAKAAGLVGAPADDAIAAAIASGPQSQTQAAGDARYFKRGSSNTLTFGAYNNATLAEVGGNTGVGYWTLNNLTATGAGNVAVGRVAGMSMKTANNGTFVGYAAGQYLTTSNEVTYVGSYAGFELMGTYNTGIGARALCGPNVPRDATNPATGLSGQALLDWLAKTPTGSRNTAVGREALSTIGSGSDNVAVGYEAGAGQGYQMTVTGMTVSGTTVTVTVSDTGPLKVGEPIIFDVAPSGFAANTPPVNKLYNVTSISGSTFTYEQNPAPTGTWASGGRVLGGYITGNNNVAVGSSALFTNQRGSSNVAIGTQALYRHDVGHSNLAIGYAALSYQTNAIGNVAVGQNTGFALTTGGYNVFIGASAGYTDVPANATTTATNQVCIGYNAGQGTTTPSYGIVAVGQGAKASGNYAVALGRATAAAYAGSVAIGTSSAGTATTTTAADQIALGGATHTVKIANNKTGSASAALGANSPATAPTAPYTWLKMQASDDTVVYVPAWK